jgi:phosphodiesterase/alkaline phosphatase D-like protein
MRKWLAAAELLVTRRGLLQGPAGVAGLAAPALIGRAAGQAINWSNGFPFLLGVASGAPSTQGFVI